MQIKIKSLKKVLSSSSLLWSLALPPRYNDINWVDLKSLRETNRSFSVKKVKKSYFLSHRDIGHSAKAFFQGNKIAVPNASGAIEYFDTSQRRPQSQPRTVLNPQHEAMFQEEAKRVYYHERGKYEVSQKDGQLQYFSSKNARDNVWTLPLQQALVSSEQKGNSSSLWMWSYQAPHLMFLSWGSGREYKKSVLHRIKWNKDSLPLFMKYCGKREITLIDKNTRGEFTLYNFFERALNGPFPKSKLSLNEILPKKIQRQNPEIYQALISSCQKLYLVGNFGIVGVEY